VVNHQIKEVRLLEGLSEEGITCLSFLSAIMAVCWS
jgi:hypothetical protein